MLSKDFLENEYIIKEKTMKEIANENNVSPATVYNYLKRYNISTRKRITNRTKERIKLSQQGNSYRKGYKCSISTRLKMSFSKTGKFIKPSKFGGHRKRRNDGYIAVYVPTHPFAGKEGYVMEHILVVENSIKRYLKPDEVVHHVNRIRDDNRIENLQLMNFKEHASLHAKERQKQNLIMKGLMAYQ